MAQLNEPEFMIPVESSNVKDFGYVDEDRTLFVGFIAKGTQPESRYVYYEVEMETYQEFMASPSKGSFIWTHLRDRYEYEKLW